MITLRSGDGVCVYSPILVFRYTQMISSLDLLLLTAAKRDLAEDSRECLPSQACLSRACGCRCG